MNTCLRLLLILCLTGALVGCGGGSQGIRSGSAQAVTATSELPAPDTTAESGAYLGASDYPVGPLDLLEISVFQVEDLNRSVRINSSGLISLPLIGTVQAGGRTIAELEADIAGKLEAGYLQAPQVSVFVKEFSSQRVTVEGAVKPAAGDRAGQGLRGTGRGTQRGGVSHDQGPAHGGDVRYPRDSRRRRRGSADLRRRHHRR